MKLHLPGKLNRALTALLCALLLTGCSRTDLAARPDLNTAAQADPSLQIVATIFPPYDMARSISGGRAQVRMLLKPGEETHSYEPTPQDILAIQHADLFLCVGGENDVWLDNILESMGEDAPPVMRLVELVDLVAEEEKEGMTSRGHHEESHAEHDQEEHDHEEAHEDHDHEAEIDEHVWTSPSNAIAITEAIAEKMAELDPAGAALYRSNAAAYVEEISALRANFARLIENAPRKTLVFGDRFPIRYFVEEFGLDYYAAFPGCAEDTEPSAATMIYLIETVKREKIPVVFSIEFSNGAIADAIAEASGAGRMTWQTCHNVTRAQFEAGETYITLMRSNLDALKAALYGEE